VRGFGDGHCKRLMGHLLHQAVDAFAKGDQIKAEKLLEQVRFLIELCPAISCYIRTYVEFFDDF